jgi:ubiquinone/menaquinone biosynthesis C-methylase UbiE
MSATTANYVVPFDAVAESYDDTFTKSKIGRAQRSAVWRELEKIFFHGDRVLEIGCGTGIDACFLANRGVSVLACDSSPRMVQTAEHRVEQTQNQRLVKTRVVAAERLGSLDDSERYDGAFSNFGALNCVKDTGLLVGELARLVRPGGSALLCWMGPFCVWEMFWYACHGNSAKAFRRLRRQPVSARLAEGVTVRVHYPSVRSLAKQFQPYFSLTEIVGVGIFVPPSYIEPGAKRFPRLLRGAERLDAFFSHCPGVRVLADHILLRFERTDHEVRHP